MTGSTPKRRFWEVVCGFEGYLFQLLVVQVALLLLLGFSLLVLDPASDSFAVLAVDLFLLGVSTGGVLYALYRCGQR